MADQRKAIIQGLKESVSDFKESLPNTTEQDILNMILLTQYFDTIKDLGQSSKNNTIMIPHSPGALNNIIQQVTNAIITGNQASNRKS